MITKFLELSSQQSRLMFDGKVHAHDNSRILGERLFIAEQYSLTVSTFKVSFIRVQILINKVLISLIMF